LNGKKDQELLRRSLSLVVVAVGTDAAAVPLALRACVVRILKLEGSVNRLEAVLAVFLPGSASEEVVAVCDDGEEVENQGLRSSSLKKCRYKEVEAVAVVVIAVAVVTTFAVPIDPTGVDDDACVRKVVGEDGTVGAADSRVTVGGKDRGEGGVGRCCC